uniref:HAT C-terminal dimerisation domain-containing protein n=1 Tax=Nicotiana tabacum TaxID=4097 RepID=A0A1S3ZA99_TOBAC|nr:PREDICTED: uncharacterized protein LOC107784642 [Nicotiana tabacum]
MAKVIGNCLLEWKLDKVFTVTVDNASSNDVTEIDVFVKRVRQAVREEINAEVDAYLNSLFGEYKKKYSKGCYLQSSPSKSISSYDTFEPSSRNVRTKSVRTKQLLKRQKEDSRSVGAKSELERYIGEGQEQLSNDSNDFKILDWWKINAPRFPILSELARDVLVIPISSVASKCAFSTDGRILDSFRSSLTPRLVQSLVCVQDWFRCEGTPINVEEDFEFLEQIELDMATSGRETCIVERDNSIVDA